MGAGKRATHANVSCYSRGPGLAAMDSTTDRSPASDSHLCSLHQRGSQAYVANHCGSSSGFISSQRLGFHF